MSIQTATNRFIVPPKTKSVGFYQELLRGISSYEYLGNRLTRLSEQARALRQFDTLSEYASILSNLPVEKFQSIGQYYSALSLCRVGYGELDKARTILEKVASVAPSRYRAEAMVSLSSISQLEERPGETLRYCLEASKVSKFSVATIKALRGIAVLKSFEGYHRSALRDLENLYPIMRYAPPHIHLDYLNSLAVELAECGRLEEARNISNITCSSPLVIVYPEWRETRAEIDLIGYRQSRSVVSLNHNTLNISNVLHLPLPEHSNITSSEKHSRSPFHQQASVTSLQEWKSKMVKEPNGNDELDFSKMSDKEKLFKIIELSSTEDITDDQLDKILDAVIRITSKRT